MALENVSITEKTIDINHSIQFDYKNMSKALRLLKDNEAEIISQKLELDCLITYSIRKSKAEELFSIFENFHGVVIKKL